LGHDVLSFGERRLTKSRFGVLALNLCLFLLFTYWLIENIDSRVLLNQFSCIPIWATLGATVIYLGALLMYGLRMALLLDCSVALGCKVTTLGYALNTVMPFRLGELVKIVLANRFWGIQKTQMLSASVVEKVADLSKLVLFTGLITFISGIWSTALAAALPLVVAIVVTMVVAIACVVLGQAHILKIIRWLPKRRAIRRLAVELHKHIGAYPLGLIFIATMGIWIINVELIFFSINSFLPQATLSFANAAILYFLLSLAVAVPSAPAGIGIFEAVTTAFLIHTSGVGYEAGLAAATVLHAVISLPQLLLCLPLLWSGVTPRTEVPEQAQFEPCKAQPPANQTKPQLESCRHLPKS
jgi:uncharacterized membrane protein YbhN (UPF0104 family)